MVRKFDCAWNNFNGFSPKSGPRNILMSRDICYQINLNTKRNLHVQLSLCIHVEPKSYQKSKSKKNDTRKEFLQGKDSHEGRGLSLFKTLCIALENIKVNHLLLQVVEANLIDS